MPELPDLTAVTKLLADESRVALLSLLLSGRFQTVHELAHAVKITDQTASYHLKRMQALEWVSSYKQGRSVYYHLASEQLATLLENLLNISPRKKINSFKKNQAFKELKAARSCYSHLAGALGVNFLDCLCQKNFVTFQHEQLALTPAGQLFFKDLGIDINKLPAKGPLLKPCLDWTERRFHLAGTLGSAFFKECLRRQWLRYTPASRAVTLSWDGKLFFDSLNNPLV